VQQKRVGRELVFVEHWVAGSGARKPRQELKGSALQPLLSTFYGVLARCVFFYQHCFTKVIDTYCCDEKHGKQLNMNTIGKETHTFNLVKENTPHYNMSNKKGMRFPSKGHIVLSQTSRLLPHSCEKLRLMLPNTFKEPYGNHTCRIVPNYVKLCVLNYYKCILKGRCQ
jgi:hypothetical protein